MGLWEDLYRSGNWADFSGESFEEDLGIDEASPRRSAGLTDASSGQVDGEIESDFMTPTKKEADTSDNFRDDAEGFGEDDFVQRETEPFVQTAEGAAREAQAKTEASPTEYNSSVSTAATPTQSRSGDSSSSIDLENGQFASAMENWSQNWDITGSY